MATKLQEKRTELMAKRQELKGIFDKYPDLDMPKEVTEDIRQRNLELQGIGVEYDQLFEMDQIATKNREESEKVQHLPLGKGAKSSGSREKEQKSLGQLFVESDAFKKFNPTSKSSPAVEVDWDWEEKALLDEATGFAPQAVRTGLILPGALRRVMVTDLIPSGSTNQTAIVYMEETTTTNAADTVAEGAQKPESTLAFTEKSSPVRKIATVLPVTDELMTDEPAMRSYVEQRLRLFLELAEEDQLVNGSGVAPDLTGMLNVVGIQTQALGADTAPDAIYKAMTLIQTGAFLDASGIIINPANWQTIRLLKDTAGNYLWGPPSDPGVERIWGLPVVKTTAMAAGTALLGAFTTATQMFRKSGVSFAVSDQHSDFFIKNKMMLRIEERLAFVVYRPAALATVTGLV